MRFKDLFVSKQCFRVERIEGKTKAIVDPNGNYRATTAESIELFLSESSYPPSGIEVMTNLGGSGRRVWRKVKPIMRPTHPTGYGALKEKIVSPQR